MDGSDRGETVKLYDVSPGTECMGAGLQVGEKYLNLRIGGGREGLPP